MNKRWTISKIKEFIESNSETKLLTTEYHGFSQKLQLKCGCGNEFEKTFTKFKNNNQRKCDECHRQKRRVKSEQSANFYFLETGTFYIIGRNDLNKSRFYKRGNTDESEACRI